LGLASAVGDIDSVSDEPLCSHHTVLLRALRDLVLAARRLDAAFDGIPPHTATV
jgi:hypothetical protein